jgi:hypothetical protein
MVRMSPLTPTRWQRLILAVASLVCLWRAWTLYSEEESAGTAFIAGAILSLAATIPPRAGEQWLPNPRPWLSRWWKVVGGICAICAVVAFGLAVVDDQRRAAESRRHEIEFRKQRAAENEARRTKLADLNREFQRCVADSSPEAEAIIPGAHQQHCTYLRNQARDEFERKLNPYYDLERDR